MVGTLVILALERWRQEDEKFKVTLGYMSSGYMRLPCLKINERCKVSQWLWSVCGVLGGNNFPSQSS